MKIEQTLVILKPDAVERGLVGDLIGRFERVGLRIAAIKGTHAPDSIASDHYGDLDVRYSPEIKKSMVDFLISGPLVVLVLEGIGAIEKVRSMVGSTYPHQAAPGTIRGDYAHVSKDYANSRNIAVKNLVHASSDENDAQREISLWFDDSDFLNYEPTHLKHTRH